MTDKEIIRVYAKLVDLVGAAHAIIKLERERIVSLLRGIDKTEDDGGWWATSTGAEFGADILRKIEEDS